jgi:hypothetical protein
MLIYEDIEEIICQEEFKILNEKERFEIIELLIMAIIETDKDHKNLDLPMKHEYPITYNGQKNSFYVPYKDTKYHDIYFVIGENIIGANKMVIAKQEISPYFVALADNLTKDKNEVKMNEKIVDKNIFIILLEYIYNNEITFHSFQEIVDVYNLAKHNLVLPLIKLTKTNIIQQICGDQFHETLQYAKFHQDDELIWELYNWWINNYQHHSEELSGWFKENWMDVIKDICNARKYRLIIT